MKKWLQEWGKTILYAIGGLIGLAIVIITGLIMFKVIPVPEWLWWLVVIRG